jgi:hypothetical protein
MSAGDDNLFARWSRRKRAVRSVEPSAQVEERHAADAAAAEEDAVPGDLQLPAAEPVATQPPEPLPRLEDLTAESDLSAFLRKSVPEALKSAALRKMWSLDPAIRDYIGPSEYAWDFNQPGSMAGFGPLEANESVADFLSKMSSAVVADSKDAAEAPAAPPFARQVTGISSDQAEPASPDGAAGASSPLESVQPPPLRPTLQSPRSADRAAVAVTAPAQESRPAELSRPPAGSRHGGALPR